MSTSTRVTNFQKTVQFFGPPCRISKIFPGVTPRISASGAGKGSRKEEREEGKGNGKGDGSDGGRGKENGDRPPTIFDLKVALC